VFILSFHLAPKHSLYLQSFPHPTELFIAAFSDDVPPKLRVSFIILDLKMVTVPLDFHQSLKVISFI